MKAIHAIAFILVAIGGLNWGLVGLGELFGYDWNVVAWIFSFSSGVLSVVYVLVGISTVVLLCTHKKDCRHCESKSTPAAGQTM